MSPEKTTPVEPSPFKRGEGCQEWTLANPANSGRGLNDHRSSHRHGGVGGHGMRVQDVDVRDEISGDAPQGATAGAQAAKLRGSFGRRRSRSGGFRTATFGHALAP
jgi:hypothetical protein